MAYNTHAYDDSPTICAAASAAITDPAMKAVKFSSGKLALPSAGDPVIGIVLADQGDVAAGDTLNVQIKDICYWIAGGTFAAGLKLALLTYRARFFCSIPLFPLLPPLPEATDLDRKE